MRQAQGTRTGKLPTASTRTPAPAGPSNSAAASSTGCGCGCHENHETTCDCCKLTCFERPKYFCGQLLSDADLTLQETYFREKNKLYHRTMDGFGVVCGLRMSRDLQCNGYITIGDGFAIDSCGNDLVVCDPRSFNVIGELRRKNWLVEASINRARKDQSPQNVSDTKPQDGDDQEACFATQCFYIGLCYAEEPVDFATPYTTECSPAPGPCQPTRIREGVRVEIYDKLPHRPNPLDDIGKRIESCFRIFREGQFSRSLAAMTGGILSALNCELKTDPKPANSKQQDASSIFRELQAQFLHELRTSPDQYNCDLEREVCRLSLPAQIQGTLTSPLEAFTSLFELIQKYVFSCVLAQLAFSCPEPPESSCVLIGSIEIENGSLKRVLNYPRWYLWCFANFFDVLIYTMANEAACGKHSTSKDAKTGQDAKPASDGCCPAYEIDVCQFLNLFSADKCAFEKAARTSVDAIKGSYGALIAGFNFTRPGGIAPAVLRNMDRTKAKGLTDMLGLSFEPSTGQAAEQRDIFAALADNRIHFRSETLVYDTDDSNDDSSNTISQVNGVIGAPALAVGPFTNSMFTDLLERLTSAEERLSSFEKRFGDGGTSDSPAAPGPSPSNPSPATGTRQGGKS